MKDVELKRPRLGASVPAFLNLSAIGLLAGLSFCVQFGLVPALDHLDDSAYLNLMREIIPTFTRIAVPLMMMGLMSFLVRVFVHRADCRGARYWTAVSFGFFVLGAAITIVGHFPINHQFMSWTPQNPTAVLAGLRVEWNCLNFWRFAAAQLSFLCGLVPLVFGRRPIKTSSGGEVVEKDAPNELAFAG